LHRIPKENPFVKHFLEEKLQKIEENQRFRTLTSSV
jgi:hypothetical protein